MPDLEPDSSGPPPLSPEDASSALEPLEEELAESVIQEASSALEPLEEDLGGFDGDAAMLQAAQVDDLQAVTPLEEILAMPIAKLVTEVRRSFDYYEHQLYERPVERIILSGGVAHLPPIREALRNDLGIEEVCVADPCRAGIRIRGKTNAPEFEEHPAQFMVAIGLAARGASEL